MKKEIQSKKGVEDLELIKQADYRVISLSEWNRIEKELEDSEKLLKDFEEVVVESTLLGKLLRIALSDKSAEEKEYYRNVCEYYGYTLTMQKVNNKVESGWVYIVEDNGDEK